LHNVFIMIATFFGKKKITEEKLANIFVNAVLELAEKGFPAVAEELNEAPEFALSPKIDPTDDRPFAMVVLAGNLIEMERTLGPGLDKRIRSLAISKFADAHGLDPVELERELRELCSQMERMNYPSKNTVYAMGKVLFHQYDLFCFQDAYFRELRSPNPIILKRLNSLMGFFTWNWGEIQDNYRVVQAA
jgi:hypothetical protein